MAGAVVANLMVKIGADIADAQQKLNSVGESLGNFGKSAMKTGGLMTAGVTTPLVLAGIQLGNYASDLEETRNKAEVVFGDQAAALETWASTATESYGLSEQAALDYTGSLGNMMIQLGSTQDEALGFSQQMVGAAADLASFHNAAGGAGEVLDTMSAAFRGEYDALQRYIPTINAAAVEHKALEMSGKDSAKELTNMEKALAAQQIILENMGPAAGDFARTSDGLANSQRILAGEVDNLKASLGEQLLPIFSQVVDWVRQAVAWFSNLDPGIQRVIVVVAGLAAAAGPLIVALGTVATVIGALASPIGIVIAAIALLAAAWATDFGGIRTIVTEFWEGHLKPIFDQLVGWLQDNIPVALAALSDVWENTLKPAIEVVWRFLQDNVFPILDTLVNVYIAAAKLELAALGLVWTNVLKPAIEVVWNFLSTYVIPLLAALVDVQIAALKLALTALAGLWQNVLKPAIEVVWKFIQENVIPAFVALKAILDGPVSTALNAIKGLFDAVGGAIDGIGGAIQGVISWLEALAAKLGAIKLPGWLTPGSPTPFENGLRGIADGLREATQRTREFGSALSGLPSSAPTGLEALGATIKEIVAWLNTLAGYFANPGAGIVSAKAVADALAPIFSGLATIVDGVSALAEINLPSGDVGAMLDSLFAALTGVVQRMVALAKTFNLEGVQAAADLADAGGKITGQLKSLVDGFKAVAGYAPQKIGQTLNVLFDQLRGTVYKLLKLVPLFQQDGVDAAAALAEAGGKIGQALTNIIAGFKAVAGYEAVKIGQKLNALFDQLMGTVRKLVRVAALFDAEGLDAAVRFAAATDSILKMIKTAIEVFDKLRSYVSPGLVAINKFERDMQYALERWVRWVVLTLQPIAADIDAEMADAIEGVIGALGATLELLGGLVDYVSPAESAINAFIDDLSNLFRQFIHWVTERGGWGPMALLDISPELWGIFQEAMDGIGAAVDVLTALVDYVGPTDEAIYAFIDGLRGLFTQFMMWVLERGIGSPSSLLDIPAELIAIFGDVMDALGAAVDVLVGLTDYVGPSEAAILEFTSDYTQLFQGFVDWAQTTFADVTFDATAAVAAVFGDVMDGLGAAVTTLTALVDYSSPGETAITAFEADYQRLFRNFATWAQTTFTTIGMELVGAVGAAASAVFTGLGAAVTTLLAIVGYVGPSETAINRFETDYQRLMTGFATWAQTTFTAEGAALVEAVGTAVGSVFTGLGAAAGVLQSILGYVSPTETAINAFLADVEAIIISMRDFATGSFTTESLAFLTSFGTTMQTLFTGMGTALETLAAIADYTVSDSDFVLALQRFNQNLYTAIQSWATWITTIMDPETSAMVASFAAILGDITSGFRDALNLLMDIEQAHLPTADQLNAFIYALMTLFHGVLDNFNLIDSGLQSASGALQQTLLGAFSAINVDMWAAGLSTGAHFIGGLVQSMTSVSIITPLLNAMTDLANQLEDVLRAAWGISSPSKVAKKLGGYFVSGLEDGLKDLYGIPNMINDALGMPALGGVHIEAAPQRAYLTVNFEGAYQAGMSQRDEQRVTTAIVYELRRQGVALATR